MLNPGLKDHAFYGSEQNIFFLTFLGMFAVPAGKGKLEKISLRISSIYIAPATVAKSKIVY